MFSRYRKCRIEGFGERLGRDIGLEVIFIGDEVKVLGCCY